MLRIDKCANLFSRAAQNRFHNTSGKIKDGVLTFNKGKNVLLDSSKDYTFVVKNTDKKKTAGSTYSCTLEAVAVFDKADNSDDGTLIKKNPHESVNKSLFYKLNEKNVTVIEDGWVGFGDTIDYYLLGFDASAKLSFTISATDDVRFRFYAVTETRKKTNKKYGLRSMSNIVVKAGTEVDTSLLLVNKGYGYMISVESINAKKGGNADYSMSVNDSSVFFTNGNNSDDWTDLKTNGAEGQVGHIGTIDGDSIILLEDWVGKDDAIDYVQFHLDSAASLSFMLNASDETKFTVCSLTQSKKGQYSLKTLQSTTLKKPKKAEEYSAETKKLLLEAGDYYIAMNSTNAKKGGNAYYSIAVNENNTVFFTNGNKSDNWGDMKTAGPDGSVGFISAALPGEIVSDWVGYGDEVDYFKLSFGNNIAGSTSFHISSTDRISVTIYTLQAKKGVYNLKKVASKTINKTGVIEDTLFYSTRDYYICVKSLNAKSGGSAFYSISSDNDVLYLDNRKMDPNDKSKAITISSGEEISGVLTGNETSLFYAIDCASDQSILATLSQNTREAVLDNEIEFHFYNDDGSYINYNGNGSLSWELDYIWRKSTLSYVEVTVGKNFAGEASFDFQCNWDNMMESFSVASALSAVSENNNLMEFASLGDVDEIGSGLSGTSDDASAALSSIMVSAIDFPTACTETLVDEKGYGLLASL